MNKKLMCFLLSTIIIGATFIGCGSKQTENSKSVSESQPQQQEETPEKNKLSDTQDKKDDSDTNIIEKPVWNGSHTKEIGTYAEGTYSDNMTDAELIKYYNKNIKDKDYNYFVLRKDSNPNYGIIFPGCTVAFDEGTLDKDGSIVKKSKSGFISGDKIKY